MEYHVHIYQVAMKGEVNVDADSEEEAMQKGLNLARECKVALRFPDCGSIAIAFRIDSA